MSNEYTWKNTTTFGALHGFKKLIVWQKAMELAVMTREATAKWGYDDRRLISDMRGSSVSVSSNVAEGYCRARLGEYIHFCEIVRGSLGELGSQLHYCECVRLIMGETLTALARKYQETSFFLDRLIQSLKKKQEEGTWDKQFWIHEGTAEYEVTEEVPVWTGEVPLSSS
jgi:four helix bundle protein